MLLFSYSVVVFTPTLYLNKSEQLEYKFTFLTFTVHDPQF